MTVRPAHLSGSLDVITAKEIDDCNGNRADEPAAVDQDDIPPVPSPLV